LPNLRIAAMGLCLLAATTSFAVPRILIVQSQVPANKDGDPNVPIANFVSQEIDDSGKLTSVVWSLSDPNFREAALSGKLKNVPDLPKLADAISVARQLDAEYLLVVEATKNGKDVKAFARLYRGGKEIWKNSETMAVATNGEANPLSSAQSIARTTVLKMNSSALKELSVKTAVSTPEPARGQAPVSTMVAPPPVAKSDNSKLRSEVEALVRDKHYTTAIAMLRDAVDSDPFDAERRMMLINLLQDRDPASAADEARRAGSLIPDKPEFRILAARAFMQAGMNKEAQEELNEAIARSPEATTTRVLLAEIAIKDLQPEKALGHLDEAIKNEPTAEAFFMRAICRAMLGGADGVKLDLAAVEKATPERSPTDVERRYRLAIPILDKLISRSFDAVRDLTQRAIVRPKDTEVQDGLESLQRVCAARSALLTGLTVPPDEQRSHDRWVLAHKLLAQTLVDLRTFTGGDSDALVDARMNLGEAINQAKLAREKTPPQK
jgi:tetratricopeptide (TPR) repeat protein